MNAKVEDVKEKKVIEKIAESETEVNSQKSQEEILVEQLRSRDLL